MLLLGASLSDGCLESLQKFGIEYTILPKNTALSPPLCAHPDISVFQLNDIFFTTEDYFPMISAVFAQKGKTLIAVPERLEDGYPKDALFGGFTLGKHLFCKTDSFSKTVLQCARAQGYTIHPVRQGYAKCAALTVKNNLLITADAGLGRAAAPYSSVLQISPGGIALPPYACGFIGGASVSLDDTVLFFGDIDTHPDHEKIRTALRLAGFSAISLAKAPLTDCGGAIKL